MDRRRYVTIVGTVAVTGLAGCVGELGVDDDDDGDGEESGDDGNETDEKHGAVLAVESYMEAGADEDLEGMSEAMHSHHPFDPVEMAAEAEEDPDTEFNFDADGVDDYEVELADEAYEPEDIADAQYIQVWFQNVDLESVLEGEEAALVDVEVETTEDETSSEGSPLGITEDETFIALTEDGEWKVFLPYEEPPEIPDDEPVEGEEYRIVEDLVFDEAEERVEVHFESDLEIDVEEVSIYSTSLESEQEGYGSDDVEGFPITLLSSPFDPEGDEIVVTATVDGEELVVRRETYEP